jgi:hypothetical protein
MNEYPNVIECSKWFFPAVILSGWLAPLIFVVNVVIELIQKTFKM